MTDRDVGSGALLGLFFLGVRTGKAASAVRAAWPTAWPSHSSKHLIDADLDAALPSFFLLGRGNPADPLVSCQRRYIRPHLLDGGIGSDGGAKVRWQLMDGTACYALTRHASIYACLAQRQR